MLFNDLPIDIYPQLISWLGYDDQVSFVMVNRIICCDLIKLVRRLCISNSMFDRRRFISKFKSYLISENLQGLISDPYHQLHLVAPVDLDIKAAGFDDINISCKSLSIKANRLTTSFIRCVKRVQNLTISFDDLCRPLANSEVQLIADWMNNPERGLKELEIGHSKIINLSVIPSLELLTITNIDTLSLNGLNISAYSNLRCLKLRSRSIEDVSSLDGIHELHLQCCDKIRDISYLNHNYKIVIEECNGITDYSNSFRSSKIINIRCPPKNYIREPIESCDLSKAIKAREIYFYGEGCSKPLILPQCSSLHFVQAENLEGPFILPSGHHIQHIIVRNCANVASLLHFDRIYSVKLVGLDIFSLEGLGSGNRVVEIFDCPFITNFSILRHCDKVTIRNYKGFQDIDQVRSVKDLIFSPADVNNLPKDMEGVGCLIFVKVPKNILSLRFPSTLKKLVFTSEIGLTQRLPSFLAKLPNHIGKIEVTVSKRNFLTLLEKGEESFSDFIIEYKKGIHFLRKLD